MDGDTQGQSCAHGNLLLLWHESLNGDVHVPSHSECDCLGKDVNEQAQQEDAIRARWKRQLWQSGMC
jgi:hypothetical protein